MKTQIALGGSFFLLLSLSINVPIPARAADAQATPDSPIVNVANTNAANALNVTPLNTNAVAPNLNPPELPLLRPVAEIVRWEAKASGPHHTEWASVRHMTNAATGHIRTFTNSYTELATHLNVQNPAGEWRRSHSSFQITANGVEVTLGAQDIRIAADINSWGAVRVKKENTVVQVHPLCIGYYDPVDGRSERLAEITNSIGWLVSPHEVVFSNCFNGLRASILYRSTRAGLSQELLLHERPPFTPAQLGFSPDTRLELFSEFVGDTPAPEQEVRLFQQELDPIRRQQMLEPDFADSTLTFGNLRMGDGRAFDLSGNLHSPARPVALERVVVGKRFEIIDGRRILIEAIPHRWIERMLTNLPAAALHGALTNAAVGTSRRDVPARVAAGGTAPGLGESQATIAPLNATRTARRAVPSAPEKVRG